MKHQHNGLQKVSEVVLSKIAKQISGPSAIQQRIIEGAVLAGDASTPRDILCQHTVLCQTCLPSATLVIDAEEQHALKYAADGEKSRIVADRRGVHLACLRFATAPGSELQSFQHFRRSAS